MRKRESQKAVLVVLLVLAVTCVAVAVSAEPAKPTAQTTQQQPAQPIGTTVPPQIKKAECVVQGTPTEFPDDIHLKNAGTVLLTKGTKVNWAVPNTTRKGTYTLAADLAPGSGVFMSGVLAGGHPAGVICTCSIVESTLVARPVTRQPVSVLYSFDCQVQGTPVEFPDDIYIFNKGASTVAKGKVLHWSIPNTTRQGDYTLTEDLAPQKGVSIFAACPGGVPAGVKCSVTVK